jgi:hypothetical protein
MSLVVDAIKALGGGLVPPTDATEEHVFRYRLAVSASITFGGIIVAGHIAWACGFLSFIGMSGFAMADDVKLDEHRIVLLQKVQLEKNIRDLKREQCTAIIQKNQAALSSVTTDLASMKEAYREAINREPDVPHCNELLIGAAAGPPDFIP